MPTTQSLPIRSDVTGRRRDLVERGILREKMGLGAGADVADQADEAFLIRSCRRPSGLALPWAASGEEPFQGDVIPPGIELGAGPLEAARAVFVAQIGRHLDPERPGRVGGFGKPGFQARIGQSLVHFLHSCNLHRDIMQEALTIFMQKA